MEPTSREVWLALGDNELLGPDGAGVTPAVSRDFLAWRCGRRAPGRARISTFPEGGPEAGRAPGQIGRDPQGSGGPRAAWRYVPGALVAAICFEYTSLPLLEREVVSTRICIRGYRKLQQVIRLFGPAAGLG